MEDQGKDAFVASIETLSAGQRLVVWTARSWVYERQHPGTVVPSVGEVYRELGAPEAALDVGRFLNVLSTGTKRTLWFGNPTCRCSNASRVLETEALLVNCLAFFHLARPQCAARLLKRWLPRTAIDLAFGPARNWSYALALRNLPLDIICVEQKNDLDHYRKMISADRGTALVH